MPWLPYACGFERVCFALCCHHVLVDSYASNTAVRGTKGLWPVDLFFCSSVTLLSFYFILKNVPHLHTFCVYVLNVRLSDSQFCMIVT